MNFVGTVRVKDKNNKNILSMTLEHYPVMTENEIFKITEKALKKWDINYISIIHRIGKSVSYTHLTLPTKCSV